MRDVKLMESVRIVVQHLEKAEVGRQPENAGDSYSQSNDGTY